MEVAQVVDIGGRAVRALVFYEEVFEDHLQLVPLAYHRQLLEGRGGGGGQLRRGSERGGGG